MTDADVESPPLKVVFAGTPAVALPTLEALAHSQHSLEAVITREPKPQGRKRVLTDSEVGSWAKEHGVTLVETDRPTADELAAVRDADIGVVVAYGALLSPEVLGLPKQGWLNLHFSALPDLRGAAPVQRAIWRGDTEFGSTVFSLDEGMDTGPVASIKHFEVGERPTSGEALEELARLGATQVLQVLDDVAEGRASFTDQDDLIKGGAQPSRAPMIMRGDAFIDFTGSAAEVDARVRACSPTPGAWTRLPDGTPIKIIEIRPRNCESPGVGVVMVADKQVLVGTEESCVELRTVGPAGKRPMNAADWLRGARLEEGARLGEGEAK